MNSSLVWIERRDFRQFSGREEVDAMVMGVDERVVVSDHSGRFSIRASRRASRTVSKGKNASVSFERQEERECASSADEHSRLPLSNSSSRVPRSLLGGGLRERVEVRWAAKRKNVRTRRSALNEGRGKDGIEELTGRTSRQQVLETFLHSPWTARN